MDSYDVYMAPNIQAKPEKATEEMDRRHNIRYREELGPWLRIERLRRCLHPALDGGWTKAKEEEDSLAPPLKTFYF